MISRDKLIGGGICTAAAWLAVLWAFRVEAVPVVKLVLIVHAAAVSLALRGEGDFLDLLRRAGWRIGFASLAVSALLIGLIILARMGKT